MDRDEKLAKIEIITLAVIFCITLIGNGLVLLALYTKSRYFGRRKLSRMYFFILHLSLSDVIVALFSVLPQLCWEITYRFQGGNVLCKLVKYGQTLGPYLSSYVLIATAIDRYQAICNPLTYSAWSSQRSKAMIYGAWIATLLFSLPQIFIFSYREVSPDTYDCWVVFSQRWEEQIYIVWYSISVFLSPLAVLMYTYTCICREIWRCFDLKYYPQDISSAGLPSVSRAKINTIKQTIAVILLYAICSAPFIFAQLYVTVYPTSSFADGPLFTILSLLYSLNSCVNPFIYLTFNSELPRLLVQFCKHSRKNSLRTANGHRYSNSSGEVVTTVRYFQQ